MSDIQTALSNAKEQVITTNAYFDLMQYVQEIKAPETASQAAQAVAFSVDVAITAAVRQLLKNLREYHLDVGIDSISAMTTAMQEAEFTEQVMRDAGKDDIGPVQTIVELTAIRASWQTLAKELTALTFDYRGAPRNYEIPEIEEMLTREVKLTVKPQTERRIRMTVERRAADAPKEDIERVVARRIELEQQRAKDRSLALMDQQDTLVTLYCVATDLAHELLHTHTVQDEDGVPMFHTLGVDLRRDLITAAMRGAARSEDFAASASHLTDSEFDAISFAAIKVDRELKAILAGSAYAQQRAMEPRA